MKGYKKIPAYRRDIHKHTGTSEHTPIFYLSGQAAIEFDKALKAYVIEQRITFPTDKNINK